MLYQTDIIDLKALTSGPGACGSYVLLLKENISKEFKSMKLASKNDVKDFVFAKRNSIETISDAEACEKLAIFYIRALQFVAAILISVYNPPDILSLLQKKTRQGVTQKVKLVAQKVYSPQQLAQMEQARQRWFEMKFLQPTQIANLYTIDGDEQLSFDSLNERIIYNDFANSKQYKALLILEDLDTYNIPDTEKVGKKYWITIKHPLNGATLSRRLINESDSTALVYSPYPPSQEKMETYLINTAPSDWTKDLTKELIKLTPEQIPAGMYNPSVVTRTTRKVKHNYNIKNIKNIKTQSRNVPINFMSSYDLISKWFQEKDSVLDVNPAAYRSVLLYNAHIALGDEDSVNMASDFWQNAPATSSLAFSSLESLYNVNDTGFMSPVSEVEIFEKTQKLFAVYSDFLDLRTSTPKKFSEVYFPDLKNMPHQPFWTNAYNERILALADADGKTKDPCPIQPDLNKTCWPPGFNKVLADTLKEIKTAQEEHLENCLALLNDVFTISENKSVYFSEKFLSDVRGARPMLEDYIKYARDLISDHYIEIESIYYNKIVRPMVDTTK